MSKLTPKQLKDMQNRHTSPQARTAMVRHAPHHTKLHNDLMIRSMSIGVKFGEAHKRAQEAVGK